jgi:hypothetical protein
MNQTFNLFIGNDCHSDRRAVLEEQKINYSEFYVPECTPDGRYQTIQCYKSTGNSYDWWLSWWYFLVYGLLDSYTMLSCFCTWFLRNMLSPLVQKRDRPLLEHTDATIILNTIVRMMGASCSSGTLVYNQDTMTQKTTIWTTSNVTISFSRRMMLQGVRYDLLCTARKKSYYKIQSCPQTRPLQLQQKKTK